MTTPVPCRCLYVHVPQCAARCGYCDFYSEVFDPRLARPLVDAVLRELARWAAARAFRFDTIFVGGGTPTVLPPTELARLLAGLREHADSAALEYTVEANPATVTAETAAALTAAGVNRVSLGAQSFDAAELRVLERGHEPEHIGQTIAICRQAGVRHFNLDLIFGIPGQTLRSWQESLQAALTLDPVHLSCYGLTYEPGTRLWQQRAAGHITPVDPDVEADLYELAMEALPAAGLAQYEISNFARLGHECRHNLRYWHNEPYLGLGPSAVGFVDQVRYRNVADIAAYLEAVTNGRSPRATEERLPPQRRPHETAMLELRLVEGIDRARFARRYDVDPSELFSAAIRRHVSDGLLEVDDRGIRLTRGGRMLGDRVMADFL